MIIKACFFFLSLLFLHSYAAEQSLVAHMQCYSENFTLSCDASSSYSKDGEIEKYLWELSDGTKYPGVRFKHNMGKNGNHGIKLTVTRGLFARSEQQLFPIQGVSLDNSGGQLTAEGSTSNFFVSMTQPLHFKLARAQIKILKDKSGKSAIDNFKFLNRSDKSIRAVVDNITSDSFDLISGLIEGHNAIDISFKDAEGKMVSDSFDIFAGSKRLAIEPMRKDGTSFKSIKIDLHPQILGVLVPFEITSHSDNGTFILENLPNVPISIFVTDLEAKDYLGKAFYRNDKQPLHISMEPYDRIPTESKESASKGWLIQKGSLAPANTQSDLSIETNKSEDKIAVLADASGELAIRKTLVVGKSYIDKNFYSDLYLDQLKKIDFILASIRNKTSGKKMLIQGSAEYLSHFGSCKDEKAKSLWIPAVAGDQLEIDVYVKMK